MKSFIVYSKVTGKYLKRHSGSFRYFRHHLYYKMLHDRPDDFPKAFGNWDSPSRKKQSKAVWDAVYKEVFSVEAEDARVYASRGSATASVGSSRITKAPECRTKKEKEDAVYHLPSDLEVHEIGRVEVCIKRQPLTSAQIKARGFVGCDRCP